MNNRLVIGLVGKMGAGKDYVCAALQQKRYDLDIRRVSLADEVRKEVADTLNIEDDYVLWKKPYPPEIRKLLQWWGTDLRRAEYPDYWVDKTVKQIEDVFWLGADVAVVTDVRFQNEAAMISDLGGMLVRVVAPDQLRAERLKTDLAAVQGHASETEMDDILVNHVFFNDAQGPFEDELDLLIAEMERW